MYLERLRDLTGRLLAGGEITRDEAMWLTTLAGPDRIDLFAAANRIRVCFKGDGLYLCSIVNAKSGRCPEDCAFCAQSSRYDTGIREYPLLAPAAILEAAQGAKSMGAREFSIVLSGRGLTRRREIKGVAEALRTIRAEVDLITCASPGFASDATLDELRAAGLMSYHHNLETSRRHHPTIVTTHTFDQEVEAVRAAKKKGLYVCCGGIFGMGETWEDRVDLAFTLKEIDVDSVPLNFLHPIPGTPLGGQAPLKPLEILHIIALFRCVLPTKDIMVGGGREVNLRDLQSMIFLAGANGTMLGNYLTTAGRDAAMDHRMIADLELHPGGRCLPSEARRAAEGPPGAWTP